MTDPQRSPCFAGEFYLIVVSVYMHTFLHVYDERLMQRNVMICVYTHIHTHAHTHCDTRTLTHTHT